MIGFLKRDWYLLSTNLRFCFVFLLAFAGLAAFTDFNASFASLYLILFSATSIMGLFNYDDFNHWEAYAAATPNGRRTMVDARYLLAAAVGVVVAAFQLLLGFLDGTPHTLALIYGGVFFLYAAIILPVSYRFGGTKSRVVMIGVIAGLSVLVALGGTLLSLEDLPLSHLVQSLALLPLFVPVLGAAALALSWRVSRAIMAKKEL